MVGPPPVLDPHPPHPVRHPPGVVPGVTELDDVVEFALAHPQAVLDHLDREATKDSLVEYMKLFWQELEDDPFIESYVIHAVADHLSAVTRGEITKLVMNIPPGFAKSLSVCVHWPTWEWGPAGMPHLRTISASYKESLAVRDNVRARRLIESPTYQRLWGDRFYLIDDQNEKKKFENDKRGFRQAIGARTGTGERGHRFVIDDPHNVKTVESDTVRDDTLQWCAEVVPSRLNNRKRDAIVYIMQRVHAQDATGMILEQELGYTHLCLPMHYEPKYHCFTKVPSSQDPTPHEKKTVLLEAEPIPYWVDADAETPPGAKVGEPTVVYSHDHRREPDDLLCPELIDEEDFEQLSKELSAWGGDYAVAGQYEQRPTPRGGGMFKRVDWKIADHVPDDFEMVVRGWDLAGTKKKRSPYTAAVKMARRVTPEGVQIWILDVVRERWESGELYDALRPIAELDGYSVVQDFPKDPGQASAPQISAIAARLEGFDVRNSPESGAKDQRAVPLSAQQQSGNVYLVRAPWNDRFVSEGATFPRSIFKDQIDAASRAYARILTDRRQGADTLGPSFIL